MANRSKQAVKDELNKLGIPFDTDDYRELCGMLEAATVEDEQPASPVIVHIENRIKKRPTFLGDSVRNDRDKQFLNAEISKRIYKGKIFSITTKKYCEVSDEGEWVTTFDIELKE